MHGTSGAIASVHSPIVGILVLFWQVLMPELNHLAKRESDTKCVRKFCAWRVRSGSYFVCTVLQSQSKLLSVPCARAGCWFSPVVALVGFRPRALVLLLSGRKAQEWKSSVVLLVVI